MGLALCIADKSLGRNGQQIGMLMYPVDLCSAVIDNYGYKAYVSVWLSVGVFICWVWFDEGKGDILVLMCYILHNSAYPFCKSVIVTEIIVFEFCMYGNKDFSIWLFITHNS